MDLRAVLAADLALGDGSATTDEAAQAIRDGRVLGAEFEGDVRQTIVRRGGIDRALHRVLGPELSRALTELGAGPRAPLRVLDPDRYLDFTVLGEGAMGIVYRALDTELKREVAFKVIKTDQQGASDPESVTPLPDEHGYNELRARFLQEAWVTGGLEHPGIVPVYALGRTAKGVPFYSMRIVRGERTLRDAIEDAGDLDARLALLEPFLKACDAVRYAHARGVIHRDLKPDNIALGEFGEVFVLDWGLAKLKNNPGLADERWHERIQRFREETNLETLVSALGTPGYMSPEAALVQTESVDERADVYSLGAMLYQILTGKLPFEFKSYAELLGKLLNETPAAPRNAPDKLARICLRALAREPEDRFGGADEVAAAIRAWQTESAIEREVTMLLERAETELAAEQLDGALITCARILELRTDHRRAQEIRSACGQRRELLIAAREKAARGRVLKRVGVVGLLAATAATVVVAILLEQRRQEAVVAREQAATERDRAEGLSTFMLFELKDGLEGIGRLDLLRAVAQKAKAYYDSLPVDDLAGDTLRKRHVVYRNIGAVLEDEGNLPAALDALEQAHAIALRLANEDASNAQWQRDLANTDGRIGSLLWRQGDGAAALARHRAAAARLHPLTAANSGDLDLHLDLARAQKGVGDTLQRTGEIAEASRSYSDALATLKPFRSDPQALAALAFVLVSRGDTQAELGDEKGALESHSAALAIRKRNHEQTPKDVRTREDFATSLERMGDRMLRTGKLDGALGYYERYLNIQRELVAKDPSNMAWQRGLGTALTKAATVRMWKRDLAGAGAYRKQALAVRGKLVELDPTNAAWRYGLAGAHSNYGMNLRKRGQVDAGLAQYKTALTMLGELIAKDPDNTEYAASHVSTLLATGHCHQAAGRHEKALEFFEQCTARGRSLVAAAPGNQRYAQELGWALIDRGSMQERLGQGDTAHASYRQAERLARPIVDAGNAPVEWRRILAYGLTYAGRVMGARGKWKEALALAQQGLAVHAALLKDASHLTHDHREFVQIHDRIALLSGTREPRSAQDHLTLGYEMYGRKQYRASAEHMREALKDEALRNDVQGSHLYNGACAASLASGETEGDEAAAWRRQAIVYLRGALALWKAQAGAQPERIAQLIRKARDEDADLAAIRAQPEFKALFD